MIGETGAVKLQPQALELAAWETTGRETMRPPLRVEVDGRAFTLQLVGNFLRFCEPSSPRVGREPTQWNFAVREPFPHGAVVNSVFLQKLFEDEWRRGHIGRLVFVRHNRTDGLALLDSEAVFFGRDGEGFVPNSPMTRFDVKAPQIPFRFHFDGDFGSTPGTFWRDYAASLVADESSDLHFARAVASA